MAGPPLACSVRGCGRPLLRGQTAWSCPEGHSFDIARQGYLNLLQPQDRRSPHAGDPVSALEARSRLLAGGVGSGLIADVSSTVRALPLGSAAIVVELGCGSGEFLGQLVAARPETGIGIDLSSAAAAMAAKAFPASTWLVANADRRLPLLDGSVDVIVSIHARRNPVECARVLKPEGWLVIAVPAADDLIELRAAVFGKAVELTRAGSVVAEHEPYFVLARQTEHREQVALDGSQLADLLTGTYRGARRGAADRRASLEPMTVTLAADILVLRRSGQ